MPVPRPGSPELLAFVAEVAADAARRRDAGGAEPPFAAVAEPPFAAVAEPPFAAVAAAKRLRLGAVRVPADLGGGGWTASELFELLIDLGEADPDVPHILRIHFGFVEELFRLPRTEAKSAWIPHVLAGKLFGGALTELGDRAAGSWQYDSTLVPRPEGGYTLNGRKFYSTGTLYCDYVRVSAEVPERGLLTAVVPTDRAGIEHLDDWDGIGQRHTGSGTTVLTDVLVGEHETLPWRGADSKVPPRQSFPQLYLHAIAAGILRAAAADAAALVRGRRRTFVFATAEQPREDPQLLEVIGTISATAFAAEATVRIAAQAQDRAFDAARATGIDAALEHHASVLAAQVKVALEEPALRAAARIFEVGGASATRASAHHDRHWRNLRTLFSHNPTVYKARALGDLLVNDTQLPEAGHF
ncbi:acyl-CoA dehydrogenase family protein [Nocardia jejuensis]|uniref:acyl-CoA dehydrogenase family protein n=1 Tax=Nocardia jejuensis TaxID=328049 RepID=UPI00083330B9